MRAVVQRVSSGAVIIPSEKYKVSIEDGLVILLGIKVGDKINDAIYLADKCSNLRVFQDENDKMNLSLKDINGEVLIVSQFTLYGETQKGNRPSFVEASRPETAIPLYECFIKQMKVNIGEDKVKNGLFGTMMQVSLVNEGPVTIIVESKQK